MLGGVVNRMGLDVGGPRSVGILLYGEGVSVLLEKERVWNSDSTDIADVGLDDATGQLDENGYDL